MKTMKESVGKQVKSKERVTNHGEVFTAEREVKAMCDLVADECKNIASRFLEPAVGEGVFLAEILNRKLEEVKRRYGNSQYDYERNAILALSSLYGIDILEDNAKICRQNLFEIWKASYIGVCGNNTNLEAIKSAKYILEKNIVVGNALSLKCVDEAQKDKEEPIIFSEWAFASGNLMSRRDFRLDVLLKHNKEKENYYQQLQLFSNEPLGYENWMIDSQTNRTIPKPVKDFPLVDYRRISENG